MQRWIDRAQELGWPVPEPGDERLMQGWLASCNRRFVAPDRVDCGTP